MDVEQVPEIERAREAVLRRSWAEAYELLREADPDRLSADDLDGLAEAAWWTRHVAESLDARRRAHAAHVAEGHPHRAARAAWMLAIESAWRGDRAVAAGWVKRGRRDLGDDTGSVEHGYLLLVEADLAHQEGNLEEAEALAERAAEVGRRHGDADLLALAIQTRGRVLIGRGDVAEGAETLDEAMSSVIAGDLTPFATGWVYCQVVWACLEVADLGRAGEWTDAAMRWCESLSPDAPWPGMCRLNRVEVDALRGLLAQAEAEGLQASTELMAYEPMMAGAALAAVGEIRRRRGDLSGAEEALARAQELGWVPHPSLALIRLAQGKADQAVGALRLALSDRSWNRLGRVRLLAAHVEASLTAGAPDEALASTEELESIARDFGGPALEATAALARGQVLLAQDEVPAALASLRDANARWQALKLPYEAARTRMLLGVAFRRGGDREGGNRELEAAAADFERLGAARDVRLVEGLLGYRRGSPAGLTERQIEVLRLVADRKSNREIAREPFISEHTVARHLQNIFVKLGLSSRAAASAFAVEHGLA